MKKKICIIYTGGTIGMVRSENGYVPDSADFVKRLSNISDLKNPEFPDWELVEFSPLLDSSDMSVNEWNMIGKAISDRYDEFDGFVILHGTDTMSYSASALSFMLEGLSKAVIFTGAQIPLCEIRSDARNNIVTSVLLAASGRISEVCIYFSGQLIRGNRSTKRSSDQMSAFESPNYPALAKVGINAEFTEIKDSFYEKADTFHFQPFEEIPVGVIKVFPGIQFEIFESIMTEKLKGVVLETFGTGNIPSGQQSLLHIIKKAYASGTIITVCSQCMQGTVSLGTYATSKALHDIGAINGHDMTTEAALTKLYYLFSKGYDKETIKKLMDKNVRGELTAE